jgi:hypothetical protein
VLSITHMALYSAPCCGAPLQVLRCSAHGAEALAGEGGGACCAACGCGHTVLQSVAQAMQSVARDLPSEPHQLLRGWMGAAHGPEVLGWNPPFITTLVQRSHTSTSVALRLPQCLAALNWKKCHHWHAPGRTTRQINQCYNWQAADGIVRARMSFPQKQRQSIDQIAGKQG